MTVPYLLEFRTAQRQKKHWLFCISASTLVVLVCALLLFVPWLNDALGGPPAYLKGFAITMAGEIASIVHGDYPVLVTQDEKANCSGIDQGRAADSDDAVYVLSFSEQSRSLCLTIYGVVSQRSSVPDAMRLSPDIGRNYGRSLATPVMVVALQRNLTTLTPAYLSSLHGRTKVNLSTNIAAAKTERFPSRSPEISFADLSVNLLDVRSEVAKRHNTVNRILLAVLSTALLVLLYSAAFLRLLYGRCVQSCGAQEYELRLRQFLTVDIAPIAERAQVTHLQRQQQTQAQARAEGMLRRAKEDTRRRLQTLVEVIGDEATREAIQQCLDRDDGKEMQAVLGEFSPKASQRTPEERLNLLLESLREYCEDGEFDHCRAEAFDLLSKAGFREARDHVVAMHDHFRARARELEKKQEESTVPEPSQHK